MGGTSEEGGIGGIPPPGSSVLKRRNQQRSAAAASRRKRRIAAVESGQVAAPPEQAETEVHTLQKDFITTAVSAPSGSAEVQTVFDADGGMRLYVPSATDSSPGVVQLAPDEGTTTGQAVQASDSRLQDASELRYEWFDDFDQNSFGAPWGTSTTGTGAGVGAQATDHVDSTERAVGEINLAVGTTSTGRCAIRRYANSILFGSSGAITLEWRGTVGTASTVAEEFVVIWGFSDALTSSSEPTNGAYICYRRLTDGDFWVCVTRNNSSETKTVTSVVPASSSLHVFKITVNEAGTSVGFYIDGTSVATHTTNIPTAAGRRVGLGANFYKTAGTTGRWIYLDWMHYKFVRTSSAR